MVWCILEESSSGGLYMKWDGLETGKSCMEGHSVICLFQQTRYEVMLVSPGLVSKGSSGRRASSSLMSVDYGKYDRV